METTVHFFEFGVYEWNRIGIEKNVETTIYCFGSSARLPKCRTPTIAEGSCVTRQCSSLAAVSQKVGFRQQTWCIVLGRDFWHNKSYALWEFRG